MLSIILLSVSGLANLFLGFNRSNRLILPFVLLVLAAVLGVTVSGIDTHGALAVWNQSPYFTGMLTFDRYAQVFTGVMVLTTLLLLPFSQKYVRDGNANLAEYYSILLFSLVGGIMMVSYNNLLIFFLGVETLSIAMYVLAGSDKSNLRSNEAALKYFLMGSFTTGILLFGIALLYGATGTFDLAQMGNAVRAIPAADAGLRPMMHIGLLLMLIGVGFKISAAPFHFWTPDVYEGTPTLFTGYMSTVVKTAGVAGFFKLLFVAFGGETIEFWLPTLTAMLVLTLFIGNVGAVAQTNAKRMLAYSSISHAGYLLLALVALQSGRLSVNAIFFYSLAYSVATVAAFAVLKLVHDQRERDDYDGLNGLARTNPLLAFVMTVAMLSLAGIPLTGGFFGKFYLFSAAAQEGHIGLVIFAVVMSAVGIFYYLRPIMAMYMKPAAEGSDAPVFVGGFQSAVLVLLVALTVLLGVWPGVVEGMF
ncbi:NADH-quinone oxidoreductase subunit N [Hymenobacter busanensis]|uniref:NADH-quinone oxidoreductase subunit N n=1 Tax=Hymenobacter busanensis TaxID=2607656 RepID=A0A7L4ZXV7_9BACT|nr:NADH-quinone oxidoreductase subunit N [Hymenobacter busanensis]KAA9325330.1 NADH-quinone oxidoreductase subunit N [Hymenobacter busanensis]QHJ07676.1 NADH-quinone oxidoreductase subunit NuoN [Hymenobacter busanensis]